MAIHEYCKFFRTFILKKTLKEFSESILESVGDSVSISSISNFENGRSSNIRYLEYYYKMANDEQRATFRNGLRSVWG